MVMLTVVMMTRRASDCLRRIVCGLRQEHAGVGVGVGVGMDSGRGAAWVEGGWWARDFPPLEFYARLPP